MIYDLSMFFNENDMFELRYRILRGVVDKFVVVEAAEAFSGQLKGLTFDGFNRDKDGVTYYALPQLEPPYTDVASGWQREKTQRDAMLIAAKYAGAGPDDVLFCSDVDEIMRPEMVADMAASTSTGHKRLNLDFFYYDVTSYLGLWPHGTTVGTLAQYEEIGGTHAMRSWPHHRYGDRMIQNAGWHFSYFGGMTAIRKKVECFSHAKDDFCQAFLKRSDAEAQADIDRRVDIYRTRGLNQFETRSSDDGRLPAAFRADKERFSKFWRR